MDTQKATAEYRLSKWAQTIQARIESGQNIEEFCQTAGISKNAYFYWQRKLRTAACTELVEKKEKKNIVPSGWMQLNTEQAQRANASLDIEINGCHIAVTNGTDTELLKKVCLTLRSL
ncbi:MAG: IS66 family insertion sequence element accessory protein TnpA [Paludibacter sp.]